MSTAARLPDDTVRTQLQKILNSRTFSHSDRLRRFLRYCVDEALAGRRDNLREYAIGLEVFDRKHNYNPANDPIVRVEARRLRTKLKDYYQAEGEQDPLIIDVPKGSYLPSFQIRERVTAKPRVSPRSRAVLLTVIVAGTLVILAAVWWIARPKPEAPKLTLSRLTSDSG